MFGLSAYLLVASGLFVASLKYPAVALAGILCMFGLEQWGQATAKVFVQHPAATNLLVGGILVMAFVTQCIRRGYNVVAGYPWVGWLTVALFVYALASTQWSPRPDLSFNLWASRWPYLVTIILMSPLLITDLQDIRAANTAMVLTGGLLTILLLFFVKWESRRIVLDQDLGNPLAIAAMAGMVVIIIILADPWPEAVRYFPFKWAVVALSLALIVRSGSRGQLLGVVLVCITCWPISRGLSSIRQFIGLSIVVAFLGIAIGWTMQEFWAADVSSGRGRWNEQSAQRDVSGRITNALFMVRLAAASPDTLFFGLGNSAAYDPRILGFYPHFLPLEVLAEEGIIGFGLYGLILYMALRSCYRCFRFAGDGIQERMLLGGLSGLFIFTVMLSLKQGSLLSNVELFMLAIVLGRFEYLLSRRSLRRLAPED